MPSIRTSVLHNLENKALKYDQLIAARANNTADRFALFTVDERSLIAEAFCTHLATKRKAFDEYNSIEWRNDGVAHSLSESDFGIPQITKLLKETGF